MEMIFCNLKILKKLKNISLKKFLKNENNFCKLKNLKKHEFVFWKINKLKKHGFNFLQTSKISENMD